MVPPGIGPGSCPRQGHVLAIGLWGRMNLWIGKYLNMPLLSLSYGKRWSVYIFSYLFGIRIVFYQFWF
jgi:hypothetical protein